MNEEEEKEQCYLNLNHNKRCRTKIEVTTDISLVIRKMLILGMLSQGVTIQHVAEKLISYRESVSRCNNTVR